MDILALVTWITTAGGGLYLLSIWLIEYDSEFQAAAATRLPVPVISGHVLLAGGGLIIWIVYLVGDEDQLAWVAVAVLGLAASLGLVMAIRWLGVYQAKRATLRALLAARDSSDEATARAAARLSADLGPPERNFPLPVVIAHGAFALATVTLVLLTAFGVGGS
jgi:hypothetical protein